MSSRRDIREEEFRLLFMHDFHSEEDLLKQMELFLTEDHVWDEEAAGREILLTDDEKKEVFARTEDAISHMKEIDDRINERTEGWKTSRMPKVELTLIRLAVYEIIFEGLDAGIAINEAVELAKKYGGQNAGGFVNGILARMI